MVSVIMVILSLAQTIINFDGNKMITNEMIKYGQESLYINKALPEDVQNLLGRDYHVEVDKKDIQAIYNAGYGGNVYPIYNVTAHISAVNNAKGYASSYFKDSVYMSESFGTVVVNESFLKRKFDGPTYCAIAKIQDPAGVIITDYIADAIMLYNQYVGQNYASLVGEFIFRPSYYKSQLYINAIIDTGYKDRYAALLSRISAGEYKTAADLSADEEYLEFIREVYDCLGYNYSTDPSFAENYINSDYATCYVWEQELYINGVKYDTYRSNVLARYKFATSTYLTGTWYHTTTAPTIPEGAKYIRIAYGSSNVGAKYKNAILKFSNGESATEEQLNYEYQVWLNASNGEASVKTDEAFSSSRISNYIEIPEGCTITEFFALAEMTYAYCCFYDENKVLISSYTPITYEDIPEGTIYMNYSDYNDIFGTDYTESNLDTFVPHKALLSHFYEYDVELKNPIYSGEITIAKLATYPEVRVSADIIESSRPDTYIYGLYLDGIEGIGATLDATDKLNYEYQSSAMENIRTMTDAVDVFVPIFELINIVMCVGVIMIFISFSSKTIKDRMHDIGILKALGTKNGTIFRVFGFHVGLIALITCVLSTVGYFHFIDLANAVLFEAMTELSDDRIILNLQFFSFMPTVAIINCVLILALALLSLVFPMIKIKQIKPVKIIKAKD